MPKVSVIMSVYNTPAAFLRPCIESILNQTIKDLEFIIIDDRSTDEHVKNVLEQYQRADTRIVLYRNDKNLGLTRSLNIALKMAKGQYVARMDSDDLSYPRRLEQECSFFRGHPNFGLVGTGAHIIDSANNILGVFSAVPDPSRLRQMLPRRNPFLHSSCMFPLVVLKAVGGYDELFRYSQDYDLWLRIASKYPVANLEEILIAKRITGKVISSQQERFQEWYALKTRAHHMIHGYFTFQNFFFLFLDFLWYLIPIDVRNVLRATIFRKRSYRGMVLKGE